MQVLPQVYSFYLERAPDPEGVGVTAASQGQGKLTNGTVDPKEEAWYDSNPFQQELLVDSGEEDHLVPESLNILMIVYFSQ